MSESGKGSDEAHRFLARDDVRTAGRCALQGRSGIQRLNIEADFQQAVAEARQARRSTGQKRRLDATRGLRSLDQSEPGKREKYRGLSWDTRICRLS